MALAMVTSGFGFFSLLRNTPSSWEELRATHLKRKITPYPHSGWGIYCPGSTNREKARNFLDRGRLSPRPATLWRWLARYLRSPAITSAQGHIVRERCLRPFADNLGRPGCLQAVGN